MKLNTTALIQKSFYVDFFWQIYLYLYMCLYTYVSVCIYIWGTKKGMAFMRAPMLMLFLSYVCMYICIYIRKYI